MPRGVYPRTEKHCEALRGIPHRMTDNCQTLCMGCHYKKTFNKELPNGTVWGHNLKKATI